MAAGGFFMSAKLQKERGEMKAEPTNKNKRVIGGKETLAEFCWAALTDGGDPEIRNEITDNLLANSADNAIAAGYDKPCHEALRFIAEHCWKEGFIAAMAATEMGIFQKVDGKMPVPKGKEGLN
jgi:hypothetical protein